MCIGTCCTCCDKNQCIGAAVGASAGLTLGLIVNYQYVQPGFKAVHGTTEDEAKALTGIIAVFATITGAAIGRCVGPVAVPVVSCLGRGASAVVSGIGFFCRKKSASATIRPVGDPEALAAQLA